ncbi:MAG TPA: STAS domain-containing protein [Nocardioidaceae bacterium]|nr:STAS domain-containing protein [Nocardioidaceae bacterium]
MSPASPHLSVTIGLSGELDLLTAPGIRDDLIALASVVQAPSIVVDLSAVAFIDSAGMKPLIAAQSILHRRGRKLKLLGVPHSAAALIRAAGLGTSLSVHDIKAPVLPVQRARSESN